MALSVIGRKYCTAIFRIDAHQPTSLGRHNDTTATNALRTGHIALMTELMSFLSSLLNGPSCRHHNFLFLKMVIRLLNKEVTQIQLIKIRESLQRIYQSSDRCFVLICSLKFFIDFLVSHVDSNKKQDTRNRVWRKMSFSSKISNKEQFSQSKTHELSTPSIDIIASKHCRTHLSAEIHFENKTGLAGEAFATIVITHFVPGSTFTIGTAWSVRWCSSLARLFPGAEVTA